MQALLAVGVGAAYAAPYLGRMVALGKPGMENIQEMQVRQQLLHLSSPIYLPCQNDHFYICTYHAKMITSISVGVEINHLGNFKENNKMYQ